MDELEQQTREVLAGDPVTQDIFPFQVGACLCKDSDHPVAMPSVQACFAPGRSHHLAADRVCQHYGGSRSSADAESH